MLHFFMLLLSAVGALSLAAISAWLQQRNWATQERIKAEDRDRDLAMSVVTELSELIGRRIYRQKRYIGAIKAGASSCESDILEYRRVLLEWNDRLSNLQVRLKFSFGREVTNYVEHNIQKEISSVHADIENVKSGKVDKSLLGQCEMRLNKLNGDANTFVNKLLDRVHMMDIMGRRDIHNVHHISYENRANLTLSYLFFRLLGFPAKS